MFSSFLLKSYDIEQPLRRMFYPGSVEPDVFSDVWSDRWRGDNHSAVSEYIHPGHNGVLAGTVSDSAIVWIHKVEMERAGRALRHSGLRPFATVDQSLQIGNAVDVMALWSISLDDKESIFNSSRDTDGCIEPFVKVALDL